MPDIKREELAKKLYEIQKGRCFICEDPIDLEKDKWEIDHIIPRAKGGKDDENNYALTHEYCNRNKLDSDLRIARCMAKYEKIKEKHINEGPNRPNLKDFLEGFDGAQYIELNNKSYTQKEIKWIVFEIIKNKKTKVVLIGEKRPKKLSNLKFHTEDCYYIRLKLPEYNFKINLLKNWARKKDILIQEDIIISIAKASKNLFQLKGLFDRFYLKQSAL